MSDVCNTKSTTGRAIQKKLKRGAMFNYDFCEVAARLTAAGMNEKDLAYVLGVKPCTVHQWKQRYEEFKNSTASGKDTAKKYLITNGLRAAMGYDYEEVDQEITILEDGSERVRSEKRKLKHQPPNPTLLMFFLLNLAGDEFRNVKQVEVNQTSRNIDLKVTGELESEQIRRLAGVAMNHAKQIASEEKQAEMVIIDAESE